MSPVTDKNVMKDRRKHPRVPAPFEINIYDKNTHVHIGRLVNLSPEGIMLVGGKPMGVNCVYECRMTLPVSIYGKNEITFEAVCLWTDKVKDSDRYQGGFSVKNAPIELRELMKLVLHRHSQSE